MDLSIAVITYNHAEYIRRALDSILSQNTTYTYEIVVGDDCSSDGTTSVLEEYANDYPNVVRLLKRKSNLGATGNLFDVITHCKGKYLAILDGDDFYTDNNKIQKQIDFLMNNSQFSSCAHRLEIVDKQEKHLIYTLSDLVLDCPIGQREFNRYNTDILHINSLMFDNIFKKDKNKLIAMCEASSYSIHSMLLLLLLEKSDIYVFSKAMTAWRCVKEVGSLNYTSKALTQSTKINIDKLMLYRYEKDYFCNSLTKINFNKLLAKGYFDCLHSLDIHDQNYSKQKQEILSCINLGERFYAYFVYLPSTCLSPAITLLKKAIKKLLISK